MTKLKSTKIGAITGSLPCVTGTEEVVVPVLHCVPHTFEMSKSRLLALRVQSLVLSDVDHVGNHDANDHNDVADSDEERAKPSAIIPRDRDLRNRR